MDINLYNRFMLGLDLLIATALSPSPSITTYQWVAGGSTFPTSFTSYELIDANEHKTTVYGSVREVSMYWVNLLNGPETRYQFIVKFVSGSFESGPAWNSNFTPMGSTVQFVEDLRDYYGPANQNYYYRFIYNSWTELEQWRKYVDGIPTNEFFQRDSTLMQIQGNRVAFGLGGGNS